MTGGPRNEDFHNDEIDGANRISDRSNAEGFEDSSAANEVGSSGEGATSSRSEIGLEERLTGILVDGGDGDLLLQQSNREDRVLQWLQALDMQVMGACRADERLKPLLKMNASNDAAEGRLLAQLTQHFEPAEVGMLARCFCIPLVSVRVGKINKQGILLCPTNSKGNLNLTILPTSDLRLSFVGDDGQTDRLFTLNSKSQCSAVEVNEIPADNSGRSFVIKIPDGRVFHFWCSETSKLLGIELISKMKDLIRRKPSISELTGISESRLGYFATHLRAYLVGSTVVGSGSSSAPLNMDANTTSIERYDTAQDGQLSSTSSKSLRSRLNVNQSMKANSSFQGSLSPRLSSFKEGLPRTLSSLRNISREKLRRRGDIYLSAVDDSTIVSPVAVNASCSNQSESDKGPEVVASCSLSSSSFLESLGKLTVQPTLNSASQISYMASPLLSPYYCWCPPGSSGLQYSQEPPAISGSSSESAFLPPLSSLLPANMPSCMLTAKPTVNLSDCPLLDFPAFLPDPLIRLPRPTSQQIPTFNPLICDPIVHIPVIDICSSGQGYLVSAGPAISTGIPPLHSNLMNPLIPQTDSMLENGARETLRRLLISGSTQSSSPLMDVLPAMFTNGDENRNMLVAGSRGLYSGTSDVDVIANSIAAMSMVSLPGSRGLYTGTSDVDVIANSIAAMSMVSLPGISTGGTVLENRGGSNGFDIQEEGCSGLGGSCSEDQGTFCSNYGVKRSDE
ncbi:PREDICTED: uncharacterized protein LOC101294017 [Fragaria vesca subsp. vesca]|uniref:uncharacterized protein LOC101294017 n=1 Tax=Fragaria vesca subsp. vesca TaxID=101020 RepID=UPI0002C37741|nr:PREDICTED: uncharacterized protein LOC101294017 [Fragaria vesca subsp. vesca]